LLQPISVRWVSDDRLEVAWGRRRLWVARQLKWTKILAHVGMWKPEETLLNSTTENLFRRHLNPAQEKEAFRIVFAEHEKQPLRRYDKRTGQHSNLGMSLTRAWEVHFQPCRAVSPQFTANQHVISGRRFHSRRLENRVRDFVRLTPVC
jgi:hypothetical protein